MVGVTRGKIVTVFGGSGFVGSYVVKELAEAGYMVRVVSRNAQAGMPVKPAGDVGQIVLQNGNIRDEASVERAVKDSYAVVNLVGVLYQRGKQRFSAVHAQGAERLAKAAKEAGVEKFVHISALGVDTATKTHYGRSKAAGEKAVKAAFEEATILRPSIIFGREDNFFNLFAWVGKWFRVLPLIGGGNTKFQPVYVGDVAFAVRRAIEKPIAQGKLYELGGPEVKTFKELMQYICKRLNKRIMLVSLPFSLSSFMATFMELMPRPMLTRDQVNLLKVDNVVNDKALKLKDLGVAATSVEAIVPYYIR